VFKRISAIIVFCFFASQSTYAQLTIESINQLNRIERSELYLIRAKDLHSGVLPIIHSNDSTVYQYSGGLAVAKPKFKTLIQPLTSLRAGIALSGNTETILYDLGLGVDYTLTSKKFYTSLKVLPYISKGDYFRDSLQRNLNMDPGVSRSFAMDLFVNTQFLMAYQLNNFFTFSGGYGKNSFGDGYRSLLLSDNTIAYPYLKIETDFGGIKYVNLYTMWGENTGTPNTPSLDRKKFTAQHFLSWNITKSFNLSIFEAVIWQNKDTLLQRGFDVNYLNPVVFYRPVEYGIGSSDNVILGLSSSYKFDDFSQLYGQVILDEFLLSEIRARSNWWGNKYGFQLGYKNRSFFLNDLFFQTEFNMVRPFTYSHKFPEISYGHLSSASAHPIGANFYEILNRLSYIKGNIRFSNTLTYAGYGIDSSTVNYGQNIFQSYANRSGDYDHEILQGNKLNVFTETFNMQKQLGTKLNLYLSFTYRWRFVNQAATVFHEHTMMIGLISRFGNSYTDY
jgi:hypothetical protein